ncbi:MAG: DNA photolyase [Thermobacillus sp. ZCTH02-B1]|uniref:SPL family radical SAM protein n=1 Tax=Thermobacillus sp. ZCTH02-B1 TaxID=1858795 RepID=UPI000B56CF8F|nr:radical SAM protein [Thermobacillus sp. ZCTH02-B1]OUM95885.1 MAG: DNA photolyase [Thermobacillus sp. ZCTH02-B1]
MSGTEIRFVTPGRLLNPAGGFLEGYTHTLNPYAGCAFGCSYCYVRRMPVGLFRGRNWGEWIDVKRVNLEAFRKEWRRSRERTVMTVFMGSATDPYQPVEARYGITRALLEAMAEMPPDFLLLQTRSPLVVRDRELLRRFGGRLRVSLTIETDLESVRRRFTPKAPPVAARWRALRTLLDAGIDVQIAVSPLLPHSESFAVELVRAAPRIVVDDFFHGDGACGKRTEALGIRAMYEQAGEGELYHPETARRFFRELRLRAEPHGSTVLWSREGFLPP